MQVASWTAASRTETPLGPRLARRARRTEHPIVDAASIALLGLAGVLILVFPVHFWREAARVRRRTARARGRVVGIVERDRAGESTPCTTYHAQISFDAGGREATCVDSFGTSWSRPSIGAAIAVSYDPRDPANADVARGQSPALGHALAIGSCCVGLAALAGAVLWR